jgi:hypothetical protein
MFPAMGRGFHFPAASITDRRRSNNLIFLRYADRTQGD